MLGGLDEPAEDSVGIDCKDPGHGANAEPFCQCRHDPAQLVGLNLFAMKRGAQCREEIAVAAQASKLAPPSSTGMTIGAQIATSQPAPVVTTGMRTEVL